MTMLNYYEGADGNMYHASQENATTSHTEKIELTKEKMPNNEIVFF
jgi:hypothetical protein